MPATKASGGPTSPFRRQCGFPLVEAKARRSARVAAVGAEMRFLKSIGLVQ